MCIRDRYGTCSTSVVQPEMKVEWQEEITKVLLLSTERSKRKHSTYTLSLIHIFYVEPTRSTADIVINSGMNPIAFELVKNTIQKILDEEA